MSSSHDSSGAGFSALIMGPAPTNITASNRSGSVRFHRDTSDAANPNATAMTNPHAPPNDNNAGGLTRTSTFSVSSSLPSSSPWNSVRGEGGNYSTNHSGHVTVNSSSLHGNLMRTIQDRDPMKIYELIKILGEGSMGSVAMVKKREVALGGSARPHLVKRRKPPPSSRCPWCCCFHWLPKWCCPSTTREATGASASSSAPVSNTKNAIQPVNLTTGTRHTATSTNTIKNDHSTYNSKEKDSSHPNQQQENTQDEQHVQKHTAISASGRSGTNTSASSGGIHNSHRPTQTTTTTTKSQGMKPVQSTTSDAPMIVSSTNPASAAQPQKASGATTTTSTIKSTNSKKDVYYALKSIHLDRCHNMEFQLELRNEISILKSLDHPNIVRAIETFDYHHRLFIVLELCSGGDLYARDPYSERDALRIVTCLLDAISYLHHRNIVHRDLKFENIMFTDTSKHADIKIIDFGLSKKFAKDEYLADAVGTVYTMAPELVSGKYDAKADIWSIGVLAFMLLSSSMPFYGKTRHAVIKKVTRGKFHFSSRRWKNVSEEAKDFVKSLLQIDPADRPQAEEALNLPWIVSPITKEEINVKADVEMMDAIQASIQAFANYGVLKKLALMVVAYRSTTEELGFLRRMFTRFDTHHEGEITEEEFSDALAAYNYRRDEIHELYRGIDVDGTGQVHYMEFLAATIEALGPIEEERLAEAFDRIDSDDSGFITLQNLRDFLGEEVPTESLEKIIAEADLDHSRCISYAEFLEMWNAESEQHLKVCRRDVQNRRIISREPSFVSSISSTDDEEFDKDVEFNDMVYDEMLRNEASVSMH